MLVATEPEDEKAQAARAEKTLDRVRATAAAIGVPVETVRTVSARPLQPIIATAKERGCDLISMASHGRSGVAALILGSETAKVLTHSKIPGLVFRSAAAARAAWPAIETEHRSLTRPPGLTRAGRVRSSTSRRGSGRMGASGGGRLVSTCGYPPALAAEVLLSTALTDAVYVLFTSAVAARRRIAAATWSSCCYLLPPSPSSATPVRGQTRRLPPRGPGSAPRLDRPRLRDGGAPPPAPTSRA